MHLYQLACLHHYISFTMYWSNQGEDYHSQYDGPLVSYFKYSKCVIDIICRKHWLISFSGVVKWQTCPEHTLQATNLNFTLEIGFLSQQCVCKSRKIIDPLMLSQRVHWWGKIKKPLNSAIANNEPSLLKLQQALIGFKVMKKTTWSIIIKAWCRHVRARALCCDWQGRAPSIGARTGPCPWGSHPSTNINISESAAPEAFTLIFKILPLTGNWW